MISFMVCRTLAAYRSRKNMHKNTKNICNFKKQKRPRNIILGCQRGKLCKIFSHAKIKELSVSDAMIDQDEALYPAVYIFGYRVGCAVTEII